MFVPHLPTVTELSAELPEFVSLERRGFLVARLAMLGCEIGFHFFSMTPHATRPPDWPLGCEVRSSLCSCTMTERPMMEFVPLNARNGTSRSEVTLPDASAV